MPAKVKTTRAKMNISDRHIEVYDQYLNGELNAALRVAFEAKLKNDPLFRKEFEHHTSIRTSIENEGRMQLKQDLIGLTGGINIKDTQKYRPRKSTIGQWVLKVLLLILLIAGGVYYWFVMKDSEEQIKPTEDKTEQVVPLLDKKELNDTVEFRKVRLEEINQEVQVTHDTIYMFESENGIIDAEEMNELIRQGAVIVDTIYETQVDTVYQIE